MFFLLALLWNLSASGQDVFPGMKRELYHLGAREYGIEMLCTNIAVQDDVLYLIFTIKNDSALSYELSTPWFAVESKRLTRRGLQYEKAVFPLQAYGLGVVPPGAERRLVFTFDKLTLLRGQVLRAYFYETGGSRNLVMTLGMRDINEVKRQAPARELAPLGREPSVTAIFHPSHVGGGA